MAFAIDDVAQKIGPKQPDGTVQHTEAVTFRGWLGEGEGAATNYRLYTSPWGERWLELTEADIVHQQQLDDGSSIIWVHAEAKITKCRSSEACDFAKQEIEDPDDLTLAARVPKY